MRTSPTTWLLRSSVVLLVLLLWWGVSHGGRIPAILLPTPEAVARAFVRLVENGRLFTDIKASAARTLTGFALSATLAFVLAWTDFRSRLFREAFRYPLEALRVVPPLALIPLLILWLGINEAPKVAIVVLASFFPVYLSAKTALKGVDPKLLEVGRVLHFTDAEIRRRIVLPSAMPGFMTGLRLGFGYAWRALVGAELFAASSGLGFMINESADFGKTDVVFVGILTIAVLGILADALLGVVVARAGRAASSASRLGGAK